AGRALLDADLARAGRRNVDVFKGENFRTAGFVNPHCCDHGKYSSVTGGLRPALSTAQPVRRAGIIGRRRADARPWERCWLGRGEAPGPTPRRRNAPQPRSRLLDIRPVRTRNLLKWPMF